MYKPVFISLLCLVGLAGLAPAIAATADERTPAPAASAPPRPVDDRFLAARSVQVDGPTGGDLFVSGGSIEADAPVAGDVVAFGGELRLRGDVGRSVYAAAGQLGIDGRVARNVRVAGGQVEFAPPSVVGGNLLAAGGQLRLYGAVQGHVQVAAGRVLIDGPVAGDVTAHAGRLELGPRARIGGALRYRSDEPLRRDPAAQVAGPVERLGHWRGDERAAAGGGGGRRDPDPDRGVGAAGLVWTLGLVVLAGVWLALLPGFSARVARTLRERPARSLLLGFVFLVCVPVAALLLAVTLIGVPLALLALAAYAALLPLAYVGAAAGLGDWALQRWQPQRAARLPARLSAAAVVLLALYALGWVPLLGSALAALALLAGLGALLLQTRGAPSATATATATAS